MSTTISYLKEILRSKHDVTQIDRARIEAAIESGESFIIAPESGYPRKVIDILRSLKTVLIGPQSCRALGFDENWLCNLFKQSKHVNAMPTLTVTADLEEQPHVGKARVRQTDAVELGAKVA